MEINLMDMSIGTNMTAIKMMRRTKKSNLKRKKMSKLIRMVRNWMFGIHVTGASKLSNQVKLCLRVPLWTTFDSVRSVSRTMSPTSTTSKRRQCL